ncbi:MAG: DUF1223 domain-containing protein [Alphaproteobacteria bacterium]|nr:DUF1223 domain-containing protein [Alphaproteobacteria bacterium]
MTRWLTIALFLAGAALIPSSGSAGPQGPVIVELYTSQGCDSCPPADAYLVELIKRKGVIALSFHVNHWDYLGWKDTFGSERNAWR